MTEPQDLDSLVQEIRHFVAVGWQKKHTPYRKIVHFYRQYVIEQQKRTGKKNYIMAQFALLFGRTHTWALSIEVLSRVAPEHEEKIFRIDGLLRAPLGDIVTMLKNENGPRFLRNLSLEEDFRKSLCNFFWSEYRGDENLPVATSQLPPKPVSQQYKNLSSSKPKPIFFVQPIKLIQTKPVSPVLNEEEVELQAIRNCFALTSSRIKPIRVDLTPIPQPITWESARVMRVVAGKKIED